MQNRIIKKTEISKHAVKSQNNIPVFVPELKSEIFFAFIHSSSLKNLNGKRNKIKTSKVNAQFPKTPRFLILLNREKAI